MSSSVELVKLSSLSQNSKSKSNLNPKSYRVSQKKSGFSIFVGHALIPKILKVREALKNHCVSVEGLSSYDLNYKDYISMRISLPSVFMEEYIIRPSAVP